nr:MAG TPA: hypothetical protein [Caudoviricetes sp.]
MSQINVNRNTFLEKEEVMNMQSFLQNSLLGNRYYVSDKC